MRYDALYGRQSVEKPDSISVESQLEYCRYESHGAPCIEYIDKGFSGKDTNRPGFERMMADVRQSKIRRVIVYKLDRISRSILDFANMMDIFQTYHVEFISSTEKFDTSTPIGRAMLNICIVFAQLERETIQRRIADAYQARSRRGFYMGGRIPYGYRLKDVVMDQVHTSMYEEVPEESAQLKTIFSLYADPANSLGDIVRYLNGRRIPHLRGGRWTTARLSEMLRNPIYVKADLDVYRFFQEQGADICSPAAGFTGVHSCYLYRNPSSSLSLSDAGRQGAMSGKSLVLAPHQGIISSRTWLACRRRCLNHRQSACTCKAKNSWLSGKIKCGRCGYALTVRKSKTKWERYFVCSQAGNLCEGARCTIYAQVLEEYVSKEIQNKLARFDHLNPIPADNYSPQNADLKMRLAQVEEEIKKLISRTADANQALLKYINRHIAELDSSRQALQEQLHSARCLPSAGKASACPNYPARWLSLPFEKKQAAADLLISLIRISDGRAEIHWNI